ncbi:PGF-pre-PGF domain-containing protein [Candidatus Woesearchaeota archaeon]|nr:MAG: PGF-pre-PGF domain-containing protein [Candidatus Woesearchaeota archaeon]
MVVEKRYFFIVFLILLSFFIASCEKNIAGRSFGGVCPSFTSQNTIIAGNCVVTGELIVLPQDTNISIVSGGSLTLVNSELTMNNLAPGSAGIYVLSGGSLNVTHSVMRGNGFLMRIDTGSSFSMVDSTVEDVGFNDDIGKRGIEVYTTVTKFSGNRFTDSWIPVTFYSDNNRVERNIFDSNNYGIVLHGSDYNIIDGNVFEDIYVHDGITFVNAHFNTVSNNNFTNIQNTLFFNGAGNNLIFGNVFVDPAFGFTGTEYDNSWNSSVQGNTWLLPDGTGFSQTCADENNDTICDSPYVINAYNTDYLPVKVGGIVRSCSDSDGGKMYAIKGNVTTAYNYTSVNTYPDECVGDLLYEKYCMNNLMLNEQIDCVTHLGYNSCIDGACVNQTQPSNVICSDTDGGMNLPVFGYTSLSNETNVHYDDYCVSPGSMYEQICVNNHTMKTYKGCNDQGYAGCHAGACIGNITTACVDSDGGMNASVVGWVHISSNPGSYRLDTCSGTSVLEAFCNGTTLNSTLMNCNTLGYTSCFDGACVNQSAPGVCSDTDGGVNPPVYGEVSLSNESGGTADLCYGGSGLLERFCSGNVANETALNCTSYGYSGCSNGACVNQNSSCSVNQTLTTCLTNQPGSTCNANDAACCPIRSDYQDCVSNGVCYRDFGYANCTGAAGSGCVDTADSSADFELCTSAGWKEQDMQGSYCSYAGNVWLSNGSGYSNGTVYTLLDDYDNNLTNGVCCGDDTSDVCCVDSDKGLNISIKGTLIAQRWNIGADNCVNLTTVSEYYCESATIGRYTPLACPAGDVCFDGACTKLITSCTAPLSGDWFISQICSINNSVVVLPTNGDLNILSGGSLTLKNAQLWLNGTANGNARIQVFPGGAMNISGSLINSTNNSRRFTFFVESNTSFSMTNSKLEGSGFGWTTPDPGGNPGLTIHTTVTSFYGNSFRNNFLGVSFGSDNNKIFNNSFVNNADGIASSSRRNLIENNSFVNISYEALILTHSEENMVRNNYFNVGRSILMYTTNSLFENNRFLSSYVYLSNGNDNNLFVNNSYNSTGLSMFGSSNNQFINESFDSASSVYVYSDYEEINHELPSDNNQFIGGSYLHQNFAFLFENAYARNTVLANYASLSSWYDLYASLYSGQELLDHEIMIADVTIIDRFGKTSPADTYYCSWDGCTDDYWWSFYGNYLYFSIMPEFFEVNGSRMYFSPYNVTLFFNDSTNKSFLLNVSEHTDGRWIIQLSDAYCGDNVCNNGESCSSCSADCGQCQQGGGGGGGGGGGPARATVRTSTFDYGDTLYKLTLTYNGTKNINISVNDTTVVPEADLVYDTFFINGTMNITTASLDFKVSKQWINQNNADGNSISLKQKTVNWKTIPLTKTKEDAVYVYYKAQITQLGSFAITALQNTQAPEQQTPETIQNDSPDGFTDEGLDDVLNKNNSGFNLFIYVIVLICMLGGIVGFFFYRAQHTIAREKTDDQFEKLKEYVNKELDKGVSLEEIKHALITAGWKEHAVDIVIAQVKKS